MTRSSPVPSPREPPRPRVQAYTVEEVADMLHIGRDKVYYLLRTGQLRSIKIGKTAADHRRSPSRVHRLARGSSRMINSLSRGNNLPKAPQLAGPRAVSRRALNVVRRLLCKTLPNISPR